MLTIRTARHLPSCRTIASFRSCRTVSRSYHSILQDQGRMMTGYAQLLAQDARRKWRNSQWQGHV